MSRYDIARIVAGVIVMLIGVAVGVGSFQLRGGKPPSWPDIVAKDATVRLTAGVMAIVAAVLIVAGAAAALGIGWGYAAAMIAIGTFVLGGFLANYVLFGDLRPRHTVPNVIVGALIAWLLWVGYPGSTGGIAFLRESHTDFVFRVMPAVKSADAVRGTSASAR